MSHPLLKEPLLHFTAIGLALFALYSAVGNNEAREGHITLTHAEITRLADTWQRRWNRPPSQQDMREVIEARVREEVLYREALSLGMDRNDPVVRRRMSQKMAFMFEDLSTMPQPDEQQLADFLAAEHDQFLRPTRYSLRHIFFSRDQRGAAVESDARAHLQRLQSEGEQSSLLSADRFLHPPAFNNASSEAIARQLGKAFVDGLTGLETQRWQGPVMSAYGTHLVYIEGKRGAYLPPLAEIREEVLQQWQVRERRRQNDAAYQRLRQHYTVDVDWPFEQEAASL